MMARTAIRIAVAGVIAASVLGAGWATTAHHQRDGSVGTGSVRHLSLPDDLLPPPVAKWPACPNCYG